MVSPRVVCPSELQFLPKLGSHRSRKAPWTKLIHITFWRIDRQVYTTKNIPSDRRYQCRASRSTASQSGRSPNGSKVRERGLPTAIEEYARHMQTSYHFLGEKTNSHMYENGSRHWDANLFAMNSQIFEGLEVPASFQITLRK